MSESEPVLLFGDLSGKTALVTGASGGLGLHFARLLARYGVAVTLAARRKAALDSACAAIADAGGDVQGLALDVADAGSVRQALHGRSFDILVNNAGVSGAARAADLSESEWDQVLDTNLKGVFLVAQAVAQGMRASGRGGAIVNIASILGHRVAGGVSAYAASKAGVIQLTKALALEWARDGIRVNALCPGYIETDINRDFFATEPGQQLIRRIPQRRLGQPEELDGALLLLASQAGSYITGSTIAVDGGHLVSSL
ncbi:MAG: SDR family NAD(P)-dependent oxidoreductase [Bosea sp. (in: a-proteobacteria)]|uniref:SDR family NAD(P)-dependent oxidoreductase n=1 Tax=Bosea sp. (in: a-proteobacteria) TaxID=1871050 RepID=UPI003F7B54DE